MSARPAPKPAPAASAASKWSQARGYALDFVRDSMEQHASVARDYRAAAAMDSLNPALRQRLEHAAAAAEQTLDGLQDVLRRIAR